MHAADVRLWIDWTCPDQVYIFHGDPAGYSAGVQCYFKLSRLAEVDIHSLSRPLTVVFSCASSEVETADTAPPVAGRTLLADGIVVGVGLRSCSASTSTVLDFREDSDEVDGDGPA